MELVNVLRELECLDISENVNEGDPMSESMSDNDSEHDDAGSVDSLLNFTGHDNMDSESDYNSDSNKR